MSYNRDMPTGNCQKCINTFGTLGCCDTISNEWRYNCDDGMRYFDERKPQTNADHIRAMTDEELARFIAGQRGWYCDFKDPEEEEYPKVLDWLKAPVEVQDG